MNDRLVSIVHGQAEPIVETGENAALGAPRKPSGVLLNRRFDISVTQLPTKAAVKRGSWERRASRRRFAGFVILQVHIRSTCAAWSGNAAEHRPQLDLFLFPIS
jgi:hypothetical protein